MMNQKIEAPKYLKDKLNGIFLNLDLDSHICFVHGNSGTGKTMLFEFLRELRTKYNNIKCLNYNDIGDVKDDLLGTFSNQLIAIDNADIILDVDTRLYISLDTRNRYLIFARDPNGFLISHENIRRLKFDEVAKTLSLSR